MSKSMSPSDAFAVLRLFNLLENFLKTVFGNSPKRFLFVTAIVAFGIVLPLPIFNSAVTKAYANATYHNFSSGSLSLSLSSGTANLISRNDDWTNVPSIEGYAGTGLSGTFGVDPQTILGTEFAGNALPFAGSAQVNANKGNPNAYNAGGVTEFDTGTYISFGVQGNVQANPYMVFYLNTTGFSAVVVDYDVIDIDNGSNNSVSQIALQYRVGETGNFVNLPAGFVADATDGPTISGRISHRTVTLPLDASNKAKVQVRLITTNAAATDGSSTPDEWIGLNNFVVSAQSPTGASALVGGRVFNPEGRPLANANVTMFDSFGEIRVARTNAFGFYQFTDVPVSAVYFLEVSSKKYIFTEPVRTLTVTNDVSDCDFYASPIPTLNSKSPETFTKGYKFGY